MLKDWASAEVGLLPERAELFIQMSLVKLWPYLESEEASQRICNLMKDVLPTLTPEIYEAIAVVYFA